MTRVAVALLQRGGAYLLCRRKRGGRYELKWEFPGGKFEPGETAEECVARELMEELSIAAVGPAVREVQQAYYADGGMFEVYYCTVASFNGEIRNNVFEEIRWVPRAELTSLDILEGNRAIVQRLAAEA